MLERANTNILKFLVKGDFYELATNGQGLLQGWNSLLVRPEPLLIKDIKAEVNKQKLKIECPAQMKHSSDKMTIDPTSSQHCSKPNVSGSTYAIIWFLLNQKANLTYNLLNQFYYKLLFLLGLSNKLEELQGYYRKC